MAARRATKLSLKGKLASALASVAAALENLEQGGVVIGGIAVILRGVPRATRDIDLSVAPHRGGVQRLADHFAEHGLAARIPDALQFASENQVLLLRHAATGIDVDVSLAWLSFELDAIANAERFRIRSASVPVARAEDLVIYKAVAWRPQDQQDVERLLLLHGRDMDLKRVRSIVQQFAEALDAPERVTELERLIAQALE
jgi:hypothetical protein